MLARRFWGGDSRRQLSPQTKSNASMPNSGASTHAVLIRGSSPGAAGCFWGSSPPAAGCFWDPTLRSPWASSCLTARKHVLQRSLVHLEADFLVGLGSSLAWICLSARCIGVKTVWLVLASSVLVNFSGLPQRKGSMR